MVSISTMKLKILSPYITAALGVFLFLPAPATAQFPGEDPPAFSWKQSVITNPVFNGETFIMEGGNENGKSMILVHGIGEEGARIWEPFIAKYGDRYHLITFDLPGFGRSAKQNLLYSPENYSAFLQWIISEYAQGSAILLGHSMGGAITLHFAASYPDHVERLILVDAAGILHRSAFTKNMVQIDSQKKWPWFLSAISEEPIAFVNYLTGSAIEKLEKKTASQDIDTILNSRLLRKTFLGGNPKSIASLAVAEENFSPLLGKVKAPVYIIWGNDDAVAPTRTAKALLAKLPGAKLELIENAGHLPMQDQEVLFDEAMGRALIFKPEQRKPEQVESSETHGKCTNRSGMAFSGSYASLEIINCTDVVLEGVTARYVHISESRVVIENSLIHGKEIGLLVDKSQVVATGLKVVADIAISTSKSRLDLAAVELHGRDSAVRAREPSSLLFSISRIDSPHFKGDVHGVRRLTAETSL